MRHSLSPLCCGIETALAKAFPPRVGKLKRDDLRVTLEFSYRLDRRSRDPFRPVHGYIVHPAALIEEDVSA